MKLYSKIIAFFTFAQREKFMILFFNLINIFCSMCHQISFPEEPFLQVAAHWKADLKTGTMFVCTLTNSPTENPVLSVKSRCIFDGKALETYVKTHGTDPINNEPMDMDDIIAIANDSKKLSLPNSEEILKPTYSSIPTMLSSFQNAWDSLSLELFQLRAELDKSRKELSMSLYRQDAAVKVAINACKERDEARHALAQLIGDSDAMNVDDIPADANTGEQEGEEGAEEWSEIASSLRGEQERLLALHKKENKERKGKSPMHELDISSIDISIEEKTGLAFKKKDEILNVEINETTKEGIVVYKSGVFELVDFSCSEADARLTSASRISVSVKSDMFSSLLSFWMCNEPYIFTYVPQKGGKKKSTDKHILYQLINLRTKETQNIQTELEHFSISAAHPTLPLFILSTETEFEVFYNQRSIYSQQLNGELKAIKFHPDGLLIGLSYQGSDGIDIYDLSERTTKLHIDCANHGDFQFASNGYFLFISTDELLKLFDLRKNMITLETNLGAPAPCDIYLDIFTSIVVSGDMKYAILDKKGKAFVKVSQFDAGENSRAVGLLNNDDGRCTLLVCKEDGLYKATVN